MFPASTTGMRNNVVFPLRGMLLALLVLAGENSLRAQSDLQIYTDTLQNGWENWSWSTTLNFSSAAVVHGGSTAISANITAGWGGLSLHRADFDSSPYANLTFWIHGGPVGGQLLKVFAELGGVPQQAVDLPALGANSWQQITLSLAQLGVQNKPNFSRFTLQDRSGSGAATFHVDDMRLAADSVPPPGITLSSPVEGAIFSSPASVPLAASVTTNGHTINKVQWYAGTTLLAEDATPPYTGTWSGGAAGPHAVFARVLYDGSVTRDSAAANILIAMTSQVSITVDAQLNRRAINPLIYGTAFASAAQLSDLNFTINRSGGNAETRYNWQTDTHNRGADWYFQSIADSWPTVTAGSSESFINSTKSAGALPAITIPMIGWAPKVGAGGGKLASYSIAKYGPQTGSDSQWMPDAGNGISVTNNTPITWNNPNDANFPTNSAFQLAFVQRLTNRFGWSTNGGVRHYILDNEHSIWHSTHRDVHPNGAGRQEIRSRMIDYASRVKSVDPNAQVWGPEEFGWSGYLNSGADLEYGAKFGWSYLPDRSTNGAMDYVPWLLDQMRRYELTNGVRLLDYFTLHRYPEGAERNNNGNDVTTSTQLLRNRSTRSFWDPAYVDESWINTPVRLIPRMKSWVAAYYPGTKIGITEYNWNAENHINGATAQADLLGIFGREGLDLATRWTTPASTTPAYKAMKLYRNYDGNKSTFGDISVSASGPNPDEVAVFAAVRSSDNALTLVVINKQLGANALPTIILTNFQAAGIAQLWQLTSANAIARLSDITFTGNTISNSLPAQSITLFVVPAAVITGPPFSPSPADGAVGVATNVTLAWSAPASAASHRVYFGANSNAVFTASTNSPEFAGTLLTTACPRPGLAPNARFYWRVEAVSGATTAPGPVWTFATLADPAMAVSAAASLRFQTNFVLTFPTRMGQTYRVERSSQLNPPSWSPVVDPLPGTGGLLEWVGNTATNAQQFFRVVILTP